MRFRDAPAVEEAVYQMRLVEWTRASNRAEINRLFNGHPPYTQEEVTQDGREGDVNVNFLTGTHFDMAARGQFENALIAPNPLVEVSVDYGPKWRQNEHSLIVSSEMNRILKNSCAFMEEEDSTFAQLVLHGIGPAVWENKYSTIPKARGIEDVLIPSQTLRDLTNLPFFAIYRSYTAGEMMEVLRGPHIDPGWNVPLVKKMIEWVNEQSVGLMGNRWPQWQKPESLVELAKENSGLYWSDNIPTIDTYDFYYWNDNGRQSGWQRRVVLDVWGQPGMGGYPGRALSDKKDPPHRYENSRVIKKQDTRAFLYSGRNRIYGKEISEIIHFQFGDASAVAPFTYHGVRSLGFLLFATSHLENRLKCRFMDHVFECLLQYFKVANPADAQRAMEIELINRGVIPDGIDMVKQADRWQIQGQVVEAALGLLRQMQQESSQSFTQAVDFGDRNPSETATATMAKVNAAAQMVGALLSRAYNYQSFKYREQGRRFCIPDSRDRFAKQFRARCLRRGVPEGAFNIDRWDVKAVRVAGNGNRMLQLAIAEKLLAVRPLHGPDAQNEILRMYDTNVSGDPELGNRLNPQVPHVSTTQKAAESDAGILLQGLPASPTPGINEAEYIQAQLISLGAKLKQIEGSNQGMATPDQLAGLAALGGNIRQHLGILAQDQSAKAQVKKFGDMLGKLLNIAKGYAQRLQEQRGKNGAQLDPETQAKIQSIILQAQTKSKLAEKSHAERTAQKQISFEQKLKQDAARHQLEMAKSASEPSGANRVDLFTE